MPAVAIDETELHGRATTVLEEAESGSTLGPLSRLHGGHSSITYSATVTSGSGEQKVVLKVAPAGLEPTKNRDVLRQARLQQALQGTGVPCPSVLAQHLGAPPEVPPFYVMSFEEGDCVEPNFLVGDDRLPAADVRGRELEAARVAGLLHSLDPESLGLGDEPVVTPDQELERWRASFAACDEDIRAGHEDVHELLAARVPPPARSALIHGDYRLGNTLSAGDHVVSVIDWEIWARSDPRVDLAWFLMMCNPDPALGRPTADGMPGTDDLLGAYREALGADVEGMPWFDALVRYKQAAISALLIRNARKRGEKTEIGAPVNLLESATALLASA